MPVVRACPVNSSDLNMWPLRHPRGPGRTSSSFQHHHHSTQTTPRRTTRMNLKNAYSIPSGLGEGTSYTTCTHTSMKKTRHQAWPAVLWQYKRIGKGYFLQFQEPRFGFRSRMTFQGRIKRLGVCFMRFLLLGILRAVNDRLRTEVYSL